MLELTARFAELGFSQLCFFQRVLDNKGQQFLQHGTFLFEKEGGDHISLDGEGLVTHAHTDVREGGTHYQIPYN